MAGQPIRQAPPQGSHPVVPPPLDPTKAPGPTSAPVRGTVTRQPPPQGTGLAPQEPAPQQDSGGTDQSVTAKKTKRSRRISLGKPKDKRAEANTGAETPAAEKEGQSKKEQALLDVPAPGKQLHNDRKVTVATRYILIGAGVLALLGGCSAGSYLAVGATRSLAHKDNVTTNDLAKYHVSDFDTASGAAFASRYLDVCLTRYPERSDSEPDPREQKRQAAYQAMNAGADDTSCDPGGSSVDRQVVAAVPTGQAQKIEGVPGGYYLTMQVTLSDGTAGDYTVPVAFGNSTNGTHPRVVGAVGILPLPPMGTVNPDKIKTRTADTDLSATLKADFMPQFFTAWTSSSSNLSQFLLPGASQASATGLSGAYTDPTIQAVTVYPPKGAVHDKGASQSFTYKDGMSVEADVTVDMKGTNGNSATGQGYRVTLSRSNGHWFVKDIAAGAVNTVTGERPSGSGNPGVPKSTPSPSSTPTPRQSTPSKSAPPKTKPKPKPKPKTTTKAKTPPKKK